jgi:hypothetical protein
MPLAPFKEEPLARFGPIQQLRRGVPDHRAETVSRGAQVSPHVAEVDAPVVAVARLEDAPLAVHRLAHAGFDAGQVEQVGHPQRRRAQHLVRVGGADPAGGGADALGRAAAFAQAVFNLVIGHDQVSAIADQQAIGHVQSAAGQLVELRHQGRRIDHHPLPDDPGHLLAQQAHWQQVQRERVPADANRVSGIGSTVEAHDDVEVGAKQIDDLAFALVAPGKADDGGMFQVAAGCHEKSQSIGRIAIDATTAEPHKRAEKPRRGRSRLVAASTHE